MRTFQIFREDRKPLTNKAGFNVHTSDQIGPAIADDIAQVFAKEMANPEYGAKIAEGMAEDGLREWEFYPEGCGVPTYTIREIIDPT